ncbi:MAG TPA: DUF4142 domain-containing protein [Sphingomicrobium sp.]|nr:DUF4142 domain-containing protein [Sphingomicrobium sp.]
MRRSSLALVAVAALAGCARREAPPPAAPAPRPPAAAEPGRALPAPQAYVATASSLDQLMIRSAGLAALRARDPRLRDFAARVKSDHEAIAAQLSFAGRRINQLPTGRLLDNHAARLAALEASSDFDSAYRREMARSLAAAYEYHARYAARGDSPTLRPVARFAADTIARNVERLRSL